MKDYEERGEERVSSYRVHHRLGLSILPLYRRVEGVV